MGELEDSDGYHATEETDAEHDAVIHEDEQEVSLVGVNATKGCHWVSSKPDTYQFVMDIDEILASPSFKVQYVSNEYMEEGREGLRRMVWTPPSRECASVNDRHSGHVIQ